jgi:hypothetical protein
MRHVQLNHLMLVDCTPHTKQLHVIEKFKITGDGKMLDVSFTADDPGTFYDPWGARKPRYRVAGHFWDEEVCASNNDDKFGLGFEPVPTATKSIFEIAISAPLPTLSSRNARNRISGTYSEFCMWRSSGPRLARRLRAAWPG